MLNSESKLLKHWDFIIADLLMLEVAFLLAALLRDPSLIATKVYVTLAFVVPLIGFSVSVLLSSYSGILRRGLIKELRQVVVQVSVDMAISAFFLFFMQYTMTFSRLAFIYFAAAALMLTYGERLWLKSIVRARQTKPTVSVVVIAASAVAGTVIRNLLDHNYENLNLRGLILPDRDMTGETVEGVTVVSGADGAVDYIRQNWVDFVFIHLPDGLVPAAALNSAIWLKGLLRECEDMGVSFFLTLPGFPQPTPVDADNRYDAEPELTNMKLTWVGPYAVLLNSPRLQRLRQIMAKRALDIAGGIVGTILTGIFILLVGPLIFLASPGNIFFTQTRIGRNGKKFRLYKFRSMRLDAEEGKAALMESNRMRGPMFKVDNDPRIIGSGEDGTRHGIGWFIRTFSIDEFPQFFNVLRGDMSLVGTRPPTVDEWERYEPHHRGRMAVRPGITGLWQVSGRSKIEDFEEVVRLDKKYIRTWSVGGDILILLKTVWVVFRRLGAE